MTKDQEVDKPVPPEWRVWLVFSAWIAASLILAAVVACAVAVLPFAFTNI